MSKHSDWYHEAWSDMGKTAFDQTLRDILFRSAGLEQDTQKEKEPTHELVALVGGLCSNFSALGYRLDIRPASSTSVSWRWRDAEGAEISAAGRAYYSIPPGGDPAKRGLAYAVAGLAAALGMTPSVNALAGFGVRLSP